jgi:cell wall-associated NlpC family hydrolase
MHSKKVCLLFYLIILLPFSINAQHRYAIAKQNTPVLNTKDFTSVFGGKNGNTIKLDNQGLIRELEFIAYPKTIFSIHQILPQKGFDILEISTNDYPYHNKKLYIDSRFVEMVKEKTTDRISTLPNKQTIIKNMEKIVGYPYMWGGNVPDGISDLLNYYKPSTNTNLATKNLWILKGVDCSGLIYQATNGFTPRNTSSLVNYGKPIEPIENLTAEEIAKLLQPLDLIVWSGHVVIVLDKNTTIESTPKGGVIKTNLIKRLQSIIKDKKPVNSWNNTKEKRFVIRRWFKE